MPTQHRIRQGECVDSLAFKMGFQPDTLLNHSDNLELHRRGRNRSVLFPGDVLVIPDKRRREEACATGRKHRFCRKGAQQRLRITFLDYRKEPRSNETYRLFLDQEMPRMGVLDETGTLDERIPPSVKVATILLGPEHSEERFEFEMGGLDPVSEISGIQGRLQNLGYDCGPIDNIFGSRTRDAIAAFQRDAELEATGEPDELTRKKLEEAHKS